ncbi:probable plastid-lipid-associated protein 9, chloroplastic isoform X2 [Durio zibethinus]|uniref:Probable plastid-lipid-associated protein 9, chloroplastic isoform X2 n=1 Tax=Durio zibethinus TaxID=66656 RepID=A0A6P5Z4G4_DURZI|nr:probable plastid-lipid-associated protein 9, chloroplastic isoform X2 [Durio zibethinus]
MASLQGSFSAISAICSTFSSSSSSSLTGVSFVRLPEYERRNSGNRRNRRRMACRAMVQQAVQGGAPATYAREMERLSAKESLLLAFRCSDSAWELPFLAMCQTLVNIFIFSIFWSCKNVNLGFHVIRIIIWLSPFVE